MLNSTVPSINPPGTSQKSYLIRLRTKNFDSKNLILRTLIKTTRMQYSNKYTVTYPVRDLGEKNCFSV